jgi:PAS domain S-box-containing protein
VQVLLDGLPDAVVAVDGAGRVVYLNRAAETLLGWTLDELRGQPADVLLPERIRPRGGYRKIALELTDGRAQPIFALRKDGVEIEVDLAASIVDSGDDERVIASLRRRGDLSQALDAVYRLVFENAPIGIWHFDTRGVITACNERFAAIIGSPARVLVGLDMRSLPDRRIVECVEQSLAGTASRFEGEYTSATSGKVSHLHVDFTPIISREEGRRTIVGGVGLAEDISERVRETGERKLLQQRLAQADRMASVGTLAAGIAHEINNPLAYVIASLDLVSRKLDLLTAGKTQLGTAVTQISSSLGNAREGAERVSTIVRDLRLFSRADPNRRVPVDVERVIDSAANMAGNEIGKRAMLVKDYGGVSPVLGDEARLGQVFLNLLINAAHAITDGDAQSNEIRVTTRDLEGDRVIVEVADTGHGIPPELIERIFEPFVTTKPIGEGTGLGLSICHGIVTSLGGDISVSSDVGRGSLFRVTLPRRAK